MCQEKTLLSARLQLIFYSEEQGSLFSSSADCVVVYDAPDGVNIKPEVTVNECI